MKWKRSEKARVKTGIAAGTSALSLDDFVPSSHEQANWKRLNVCRAQRRKQLESKNGLLHSSSRRREGKREYFVKTIHPIPLSACESNITRFVYLLNGNFQKMREQNQQIY